MMQVSDFDFALPKELIASFPKAQRSQSRLLVLDNQKPACEHRHFYELDELLAPGDLLVFNDTKVMAARLYGHKVSGGKIEALVERVLDDKTMLAHIRSSKSPKIGSSIVLGDYKVEVVGREESLFKLRITENKSCFELMQQFGHIPLPPYIDREDGEIDQERYQTIYCDANKAQAVAAPTAGLHFDDPLLTRLTKKGIKTAFVTLHVGAGTFQPVRAKTVQEHRMHKEFCTVESSVVEQIKHTKRAGGKVIAVGTTVVRSLETAAQSGELRVYRGETDIFIYPDYQFQVVDRLVTNFHLPQSTLLMLVSAFAGVDPIRHAYTTAIKEQYRFFSYGDAMLLTRQDLLEGSNTL